ncbi:MAG TPA: hypothetical protein VEX37_00775 [Thermomicrobiales bacterium]|nr:hypothetical protein [Thermomicrobiales bacterium]
MTDLARPRYKNPALDKTTTGRIVVGLSLVALFWTISWLRLRPVSDYYFFPLWLGYILTVDGLVARRTGTSPIQRSGWRVLVLFAVSVPLWWLFEAINVRVGNWQYQGPASYTAVEYALLASLSFSTVVPAVLTTTELVRSFRLNPLRRLPPMVPTQRRLIGIHVAGWAMVGLTLAWPDLFFPLVWMSVVFILDPVATWLGGRSLAWHIDRNDWTPLFNIAAGTLICGWFWEMWNIYSLPKWAYSIPYAEQQHVFEMPILGYGGYIPFGYEVYLFTVVVRQLLPWIKVPETRVSSWID